MSGRLEKELLRLASAESVERLRQDQVRTTGSLRRFLDYLEPHLFDSDLNVGQWQRATGVRAHSVMERFRDQLGCTPGKYLTRARMETAARLLSRTDLKIRRISTLVGVPDPASFSRAFRSWTRMRPRRYRERFQPAQAEVTALRSEIIRYCRLARQALAGKVSLEEATELTDRLLALYPALRLTLAPLEPTTDSTTVSLDREEVERRRAERIWGALGDWSVELQRDLVRSQVGSETTVLFDLLRQKSREEGRKDRGRGVELAELAIDSLEVCGRDADLNLRVLGRVWLANARRLALDYPGAEREFAVAEAEWGFVGERDPCVEAELLNSKAGLRYYQRHLQEALRLANSAIVLNQRLDRNEEHARSLLVRASIHQFGGNPNLAIPDFVAALTLLQASKEVYLRVSAFTNLASSYLDFGSLAAAKQAAQQAKKLSKRIEYPLGQCQISWLEGRIEEAQGNFDQAEALFKQALSDMIALNEHGYAAVVSLDLAVIYASVGRELDVLSVIPPAIAILESFQIRREVFAALELLRQAVEHEFFDTKMLRMIRALVADLLTNPTALPQKA